MCLKGFIYGSKGMVIAPIFSLLIGASPTIFSDTETAPLWAEVTVNIIEMLVLPLFIIYLTNLYNEVRSTQKAAS